MENTPAVGQTYPQAPLCFVEGYIECAFFTESVDTSAEAEENGTYDDRSLNTRYSPADLSPEAIKAIQLDCDKFYAENRELLEKLDTSDRRAGQYFWYTRNGHGIGFWDNELGDEETCQALSAASKHRECSLYVGDDGQVHYFNS